jgi:hypothetical protein
MKIAILLTTLSLYSALSFAEESCLRLMMTDESPAFLCGHDTSGLNIFAFNDIKMCFVGSAQMLTDKINGGLFINSDDGLSNASKIDAYQISMTFWNLGGKAVIKTIHKCE